MTAFTILVAQSAESTVKLEPAGIVMMVICVSLVCGLSLFCIMRLFSSRAPSEHHHVPLDIDTHDAET